MNHFGKNKSITMTCTINISKIMDHSSTMERAFFRFLVEKGIHHETCFPDLTKVLIQSKDLPIIKKTWFEIKVV